MTDVQAFHQALTENGYAFYTPYDLNTLLEDMPEGERLKIESRKYELLQSSYTNNERTGI